MRPVRPSELPQLFRPADVSLNCPHCSCDHHYTEHSRPDDVCVGGAGRLAGDRGHQPSPGQSRLHCSDWCCSALLQVGGAKCSWGPSYWCANIPQASQCGAVKHCIKAVWEKETVPQDDDEVCEICKEMVGEARDTLLSNETQEELRQVFEGSCDLIPIAIIAKECKTLSDQFIPELVRAIIDLYSNRIQLGSNIV